MTNQTMKMSFFIYFISFSLGFAIKFILNQIITFYLFGLARFGVVGRGYAKVT